KAGPFPEPFRTIGGDVRGTFYLTVYPSVGAVVYRYDWESEEEETQVHVRIHDNPSDRAPVPPPYTVEPIAPEEITGPRPPVVPPPDDAPPPRVRPTLFQPPGGDYRITLPAGWRPLARVDGEYLYVSPDNAWVIACPDRARRYRGTFAELRLRLATELLRREVGGDPRTPAFGRHEGLVVSL